MNFRRISYSQLLLLFFIVLFLMIVLFLFSVLLKTMAPNGKVVEVRENSEVTKDEKEKQKSPTHLKLPKEIGTDYTFKRKIVWFNTIGFIMLHICGFYGFYLSLTNNCHIFTTLWSKYLIQFYFKNTIICTSSSNVLTRTIYFNFN